VPEIDKVMVDSSAYGFDLQMESCWLGHCPTFSDQCLMSTGSGLVNPSSRSNGPGILFGFNDRHQIIEPSQLCV
jgi:hypothetical protein